MRTRYALFLALIMAQPLKSQFYNWGWGPPITVEQSGSTITCTTYDPVLEQTRTENFSSVASWTYDDGVVATLSASGTVSGIVYDIAVADFRDDQFAFSSGTSVINSDGVIAWVTGSGTVGAAIYHPDQHQWLDDQFAFSSDTEIQNREGVVSWVTGSGTVGAAVFDPGNGQWMDDQFSFSSGTSVQNRDGVVAWVTGSGTVGAAVYDPSLAQWMDDQFSFSSGTTLVLGEGVAAWRTGSGTIGAAAYDWTANTWDDEQFSFSSSNTVPVITDGTVQWTGSLGDEQYGYTTGHQWVDGANTALQCEYYAEEMTGTPGLNIAYLWCLTIGASSYTHQCGDGHTILRRWAWKGYANAGTYSPELTIFSSVSSSQCTDPVTFVNTGIEGTETADDLRAFMLNDRLMISSDAPLGTIELFDVRGRSVLRTTSSGTTAELQGPFAPGLYVVQCHGPSAEVRLCRVIHE